MSSRYVLFHFYLTFIHLHVSVFRRRARIYVKCIISIQLCLLPAQVTRKVIRRCVSSDGVETEQVRVEGSTQQPVNVALGDGYSKVRKRTVLKSEGHQTEVCDSATNH